MPECCGCGTEDVDVGDLRECPLCGAEKCPACDMGNDVECSACPDDEDEDEE